MHLDYGVAFHFLESYEWRLYLDFSVCRINNTYRTRVFLILTARLALAVLSFKSCISGDWSARAVIVPVLIKEIGGLLQRCQFKVQAKTL